MNATVLTQNVPRVHKENYAIAQGSCQHLASSWGAAICLACDHRIFRRKASAVDTLWFTHFLQQMEEHSDTCPTRNLH